MRTPWPHGRILGGGILLLCVGCTTPRAVRMSNAIEARATVADARTIVSTELSSWPDMPLDEALERVRPDLARRTFRDQPVAVFIDRQPSSFDELHALPARAVLDVHLLTTAEAQAEYGSFIAQPVLAVRLLHMGG